MFSRFIPFCKSVLIIASVTAGLIILIEIICRILVWAEWSPYYTNLANQANARWISDTTLYWTNRPFFLEYDHSSQYNEAGMRVSAKDVFMPEKKENDFWVFLFGGSAMAGMGSNKDGSWYDITGVSDHPINESIDGYLQAELQKSFPGKKVRVFNAAVSGHTIYQCFNRYKSLSKYKPDWIVSMDGVNEPTNLSQNETIETYLAEDWKNNPVQNYPLKRTFSRMANSALYYKLSKLVYYYREDKKLEYKKDSILINRKKWFNTRPEKISFSDSDHASLQKSISTYLTTLYQFEEYLNKVNQKHLLLIQPYLAFRDTNKVDTVEKALYNYFSVDANNNSSRNCFLNSVYADFKTNHNHIYSMAAVHSWDGWVFVDYCHFTKDANEKIAKEIAKYILSEGVYQPFSQADGETK